MRVESKGLVLCLLVSLSSLCCQPKISPKHQQIKESDKTDIVTGAQQLEEYLPMLKGKRVGLVANQTSLVGRVHLVDTLIKEGVNIRAIYSPEHGFRGESQAGGAVNNSVDQKTGINIISLYGKNKKPQAQEFKNNEVVVFDIQDVGCRFYTYISTLHYVMEACAQNNIPLIVLDRPNPNASYVDGPVLKDSTLRSFVGMHPVPIVYGMTIGEYAQMINGQGWLKGGIRCSLRVVKLKNYTHHTPYSLRVAPSPNLPTDRAIALYPSLCWFEGTVVSVGRGTDKPFEQIGYPEYTPQKYSFTPKSIKGKADSPMYENKTCWAMDLSGGKKDRQPWQINLDYLIQMYKAYPQKEKFFNSFFDKLAGNKELRKQIKESKTPNQIRESWSGDLKAFAKVREKYLLYN
jgi:Uncharacterized protein conserved in bacteria